MLRLLADEDFNYDIVRGLLRRRPQADIVRVHDVDLSHTPDWEILAWAAKDQRILLTHDTNTMSRHASDRLQRGEPMAGVLFVHQHSSILSAIIDDLILLDTCSDTSEWANQFIYLPLR